MPVQRRGRQRSATPRRRARRLRRREVRPDLGIELGKGLTVERLVQRAHGAVSGDTGRAAGLEEVAGGGLGGGGEREAGGEAHHGRAEGVGALLSAALPVSEATWQ